MADGDMEVTVLHKQPVTITLPSQSRVSATGGESLGSFPGSADLTAMGRMRKGSHPVRTQQLGARLEKRRAPQQEIQDAVVM